MESRKTENGITLIGLIITVLILMILSGIIISTFSGEVFNGADETSKTIEEEIKEQSDKIAQINNQYVEVLSDKTDEEHTYGEWTIIKEASCTETGKRTRTCEVCGYVKIEVIKMLEHSYSNGTCTNCGIECIHNYEDIICTICGNKSIVVAGERAERKSVYEEGDKTAIIPEGFTVSGVASEQTIDGGLVIYLIPEGTTINWTDGTAVATAQQTYDQFVWIPIAQENINDMYMCQSEDGTKSCRITVTSGVAKCTPHNSTLMAGRLYAVQTGANYNSSLTTQTYTANSGLREPDCVSSYDDNTTYLGNLNSILRTSFISTSGNTNKTVNNDFKTYLQNEYNEIVKSVYENEGFYVGRYETSNMSTSSTEAISIIAGTKPSSSINWYYLYAGLVDYATKEGLIKSIGSTMIQGAAYDQIMKFVHDTTEYDVTKVGNIGHSFSDKYNTASQSTDEIKNIFDLEGNVVAWTTEAINTDYRAVRGRKLQC